jgi:hypothetical protein
LAEYIKNKEEEQMIKIQLYGSFTRDMLNELQAITLFCLEDDHPSVERVKSFGCGTVVLVFSDQEINQKDRILYQREVRQLVPDVAIHFVITPKSAAKPQGHMTADLDIA